MAYSTEIKNKFVELRSQDISLDRIAKQLGINKSTALDWQTRFKRQIAELKAFHFEAICERLATKYEDELEYAMGELKRIRAELKTRDCDYEPTTFLHHAEAAAWRRVEKLRALAEFPDTPSTANSGDAPVVPVGQESETQNPSGQSDSGVCAPILSCPLAATQEHILCSMTEQQQGASLIPSPAGCGDAVSRVALGCTRTKGEGQTSTSSDAPQNPSVQSVLGVCAPILSCPLGATKEHSLCSVTEEQQRGSTKEPQNPSVSQPFPHQNQGGALASEISNVNCDQQPSTMASQPSTLSQQRVGLTPSPAGRGWGEGQTSTPDLHCLNSQPSTDDPQPSTHELEPDGFTGSIVINPLECAQGIIEKCLESERANHKPKQSAS
jgi:transposase